MALVVTVGEKGSILYQIKNGQTTSRRFPPSSLFGDFIDPTGAGDNFKAGFLTGLLRGRSIEDCLQIGSDMGAAVLSVQGGITDSMIEKLNKTQPLIFVRFIFILIPSLVK
jgi:sugar/nucleoside kinase (ribokinase family)